MQEVMAGTQRDKINAKKMVSVELHVVITSRVNSAVLLSLIHNVLPPIPLLSSSSCCIIECENSLIFCLQGQNRKTSGSWEWE